MVRVSTFRVPCGVGRDREIVGLAWYEIGDEHCRSATGVGGLGIDAATGAGIEAISYSGGVRIGVPSQGDVGPEKSGDQWDGTIYKGDEGDPGGPA